MQQLSIQMGSPGSPLLHCHLQPQGYHIQTSLQLPPLSGSLCSLSSLPHSKLLSGNNAAALGTFL